MARKKSIKKSTGDFRSRCDEVELFLLSARDNLSDQHVSWAYEYGIIRLYREFESMMLNALVGAINNDTTTLKQSSGVSFPKHLTDEICEFLILGGGYFDFKGRDGLIKKLRDYVPETHYLVTILKKPKYKSTLEQLSALRNLAAHHSLISKSKAKKAIDQKRMPEAGAWLKKQDRLESLVARLRELADEIHASAPF